MIRSGNLCKFFLAFAAFVFVSLHSFAQPNSPATGSDARMKAAYKKAKKLIEEMKYEESRAYIQLSLQEKENAPAYCCLCHIYTIQKTWDSAIMAGEKVIQLDPTFPAVYPDLFTSYLQARKYKEALDVAPKVMEYFPKQDISGDVANIESSILNERRSNIFVVSLFAILAIAFVFPFLKRSGKDANAQEGSIEFRFSELLLTATAVSSTLWMVFYACSHYIWSLNPHVPAYEITPIVRVFIFEHDGAETFVLYAALFVNIVATLLITRQLLKLKGKRVAYFTTYALLLALSGYYLYNIGFFPPVMPLTDDKKILFMALAAGTGACMYFVYLKSPWIVRGIVLAMCAFASMIVYSPVSLGDLQFILAPALRLADGFKISETYFQYDLFLSFLAEIWLKYKLPLETFVYMGNVSFLLFFVGSFLFAERFFKTKGLSIIFILALIVVRIYAIGFDYLFIFQVSPLRLDLWLILLLIANKFGVRHWLMGVFAGLLVLFHRNLGIIYLAAYLELIVFLFLTDIISLVKEKKVTPRTLAELGLRHLRANAVNLIILTCSVLLCFVLFHEFFSVSALAYRKIGIGMLPISKISFYWYVPIVLSSAVTFLLFYKDKLGDKYVTTGLFIVLLAIGNSIYFFGRSHENAILNISGILIFSVFLLFDILITLHPEPANGLPVPAPGVMGAIRRWGYISRRRIYLFLPLVFLMFAGYFYSDRMGEKLTTQYNNVRESKFYYALPTVPFDGDAVRKITNNNPKVYFLDFWLDFYFYYYGGYTPQGYYNPCMASIYKKELDSFMQDLLDKGYHIVYNYRDFNSYSDYVTDLKYNHISQSGDLVAISKEQVPLLIQETKPSIYHIAVNGELGPNGLDHHPLTLQENFTIEVLLRLNGAQPPNAIIIKNLDNNESYSGFTIQKNGNNEGKYVFGMGNGTVPIPSIAFDLDAEKWYYLAIAGNRDSVTAYVNGKAISVKYMNGIPIVNSDIPVTVGNNFDRNKHFNGLIREVNISNGTKSEGEIMTMARKLTTDPGIIIDGGLK